MKVVNNIPKSDEIRRITSGFFEEVIPVIAKTEKSSNITKYLFEDLRPDQRNLLIEFLQFLSDKMVLPLDQKVDSRSFSVHKELFITAFIKQFQGLKRK